MYNARRIAAGRVQGFRVQGLGILEALQRGLVQKGLGMAWGLGSTVGDWFSSSFPLLAEAKATSFVENP